MGLIVDEFPARFLNAELNRRGLIKAFGCASALVVGGCSTPARTTRYRLTLEVETPEGPFTGTSVVETMTTFQDGFLGGMASYNVSTGVLRGEATIVDLSSRGLLFCLLTEDRTRDGSCGPEFILQSTFPIPRDPDPKSHSAAYLGRYYDDLNREMPKTDLPLACLPLLARFRDINDPRSAERVDPNNLASRFGSGVSLKRATIQITNDQVTQRMVKTLPWIATLRGSIGRNMNLPYLDVLNQINNGSFTQGL